MLHDVEWWQVIVGVFFVLLPVVLMLDFWGDERLTADGTPIQRDWFRQIEHEELEQAAGHEQTVGVTGGEGGDDSGLP